MLYRGYIGIIFPHSLRTASKPRNTASNTLIIINLERSIACWGVFIIRDSRVSCYGGIVVKGAGFGVGSAV